MSIENWMYSENHKQTPEEPEPKIVAVDLQAMAPLDGVIRNPLPKKSFRILMVVWQISSFVMVHPMVRLPEHVYLQMLISMLNSYWSS